MNGTIKVAALAALMASAAAYANEDPTQMPATGTQATESQWPDFSKLDANGDGYVSREEARSNAALSGAFSELDADKNGSLSSSEYQKGKDMQKPQDATSEPTSPDQSSTPESSTPPTTPPQQ